MRKTEGLLKYKIIYLKPKIMLYDLMVVIFTIPLQTWQCQKYVPVLLNIIIYRTVSLCYVVVINSQVLSYPVRS